MRVSWPVLKRSMSAVPVRSTAASGSQVYESKRAVDEYLLFHYGKPSDIMPHHLPLEFAHNFASRSRALVEKLTGSCGVSTNRVLDVGCAVGGLSFELAKSFETVVGVDFSQSFVDAANGMKERGEAPFSMLVQGQNFKQLTAFVPPEVNRSRVSFVQGDACNLDESLGKFDVIVASNLLCRLPQPSKFLNEVSRFLVPNGLLVLISPYSWLEEYTPIDNWVGARDGVDSFSVVRSILSSRFELVHKEEFPFLIREHERKFQLGVSDATAWQLK